MNGAHLDIHSLAHVCVTKSIYRGSTPRLRSLFPRLGHSDQLHIDHMDHRTAGKRPKPQNDPEKPPQSPETTQGAFPKRYKRCPKAIQNRAQTARRKKDRTKTRPRQSWTQPRGRSLVRARPPGFIWEAKSAPKWIRKRPPKMRKIKRPTKNEPRRSWIRLGAIFGHFGRHLG